MKLFVNFAIRQIVHPSHAGTTEHVPDEIYAEVLRRWPELQKPPLRGLHIHLEKDSPTLQDILKFLDEHGITANWSNASRVPYNDPTRIQMSGERKFDPDEVQRARFCICWPESIISTMGSREKDGVLEAQRRNLSRQTFGRFQSSRSLVCTGTLRREFESQNFDGLSFVPVRITGKVPPVDSLWELRSDIILPPVLNPLLDKTAEPPVHAGFWVDDIYTPWLLRFGLKAVEAHGDFDVALTSEHFGSGPDFLREPYMICSQRFQQWCATKKLKAKWWPVVFE